MPQQLTLLHTKLSSCADAQVLLPGMKTPLRHITLKNHILSLKKIAVTLGVNAALDGKVPNAHIFSQIFVSQTR